MNNLIIIEANFLLNFLQFNHIAVGGVLLFCNYWNGGISYGSAAKLLVIEAISMIWWHYHVPVANERFTNDIIHLNYKQSLETKFLIRSNSR